MSQRIAYLEAVIGADITAFRRGMRDVRNDLGILSETIGGLGRLGRTMTFAMTVPLLAAGGAALKAAGDFDALMRNVNSIALLGENEFASLSARVLEFGSSIRSGPTAAAEALYAVFSAGVTDQNKAMEIMEISVKTAEAGLADLTITTQAITAATLAFSNVNLTAARASDVLTRTVQLGVGEMNNFARALPYVTPAAAAAGIAFEDIGASLAYLTQQGTPANTAARQLNQAITNIVKPSEAMSAALQQLGVKGIGGLLDKYGNLKDVLIALAGTTDGTLESMNKLFANTLAGRAVFGMVNDVDRLNASWSEFMGSITGATGKAWEQQMMSFEAQVDLLKSAAHGLAITIGNILMPVITPLIQGFTSLLLQAQQLDPTLLKVGVAFAAVLTAAGPLLWLVSSLINPFGLLLAGSAALASAIALDWGGIRTSIENAVNTAFPAIQDLMGIVDQFFGILTADEQVWTDGMFYVEADASSMPVEIKGSLWDSWTGALKEQFPDRATFMEMATAALKEQHGLSPYQIPIEGIMLDLAGGTGGGGDELYMQALGMNEDPEDITTPFAERLSIAINNALPQLQTALSNLFEQAKTYLVDTVLPTFDSIGSDLLFRLGDAISAGLAIGKNGKSPLYDAIRSFLSGGIGDALSGAQTFFEKHFPQVSNGLNWLVTSIGSWFVNEGIPAASRSVGYFVGHIGALIGKGIAAIPSLIFGGGEGGGGLGTAMEAFGDMIETPFNEGFQDAMTDLEITNPGDQLATSIAGWIGLIMATKLAGALITQGVGGTIGSIIASVVGTSAASGATVAVGKSAGGGLAFSIGKMLSGAFVAAVTPVGLAAAASMLIIVGYLFNEDIREQVNKIGEEIADALFGEGWTDKARQNIENTLAPILEPILKPIAQMQADADIRANNEEAAEAAMEYGRVWRETLQQAIRISPSSINFNEIVPGDDSLMKFVIGDTPAAHVERLYGPYAEASRLIQTEFAPEGPPGLALGLFGSTAAGIFQSFADDGKLSTDELLTQLGAFAVNGSTALTPLQEALDRMTAAMGMVLTQYAAMNALAGTPIPSLAATGPGDPSSTPPPAGGNNVEINGVQDVEGLKRELRRQGIDLEAMARRK